MRLHLTIIFVFASFTSLLSQSDITTSKESNFAIKGGYNLAAVNFDGEDETG